MKRRIAITHLLSLVIVFIIYIASVNATTTMVNTSSTLPFNIPDGNTSFSCINFPVSGIPNSELVSSVSVTFGFEHECVGDMKVELRDPSGTRIRQLFGGSIQLGVCPSNGSFDINGIYTFIDTATEVMNNQQGLIITPGNYRSANHTPYSTTATSLVALYGAMTSTQANGTWQLCGSDIFDGDTGRFKTAASITIVSSEPTGSSAAISGQVVSQFGNGISGAMVTLTNQSGATRSVKTNPFGYFRFDDIEVGETFVLNVSSKEYQFNQQLISVTGNMENLLVRAQ